MITFVATAYKETIDAYQFISCLLLQTNPNWKCIIYCDEPNSYIKKCIETFDDSRISYKENIKATGFWGHYNRQEALYNLVNTEYVIQTSIQDYYTPNTVDLISQNINKYDFIFFNCIHNHRNHNILISEPKCTFIDWGSFVVKTEIARNIGYIIESATSDGLFVEECFKIKDLKSIKIDKVLTVHN